MAPIVGPSHLNNPLATPGQLAASASEVDGIPADLEDSIRYAGQRVIQIAGILLRLPQQLIAETTVIFARFWLGPEGGSLLQYATEEVAAASLYLVAKPSAHAVTARHVLTAVRYTTISLANVRSRSDRHDILQESFLSEGSYQTARSSMMQTEARILQVLGYQTHVALPHTLCINYMQTLDAVTPTSGSELARCAFAHLNTALLSPQLLYLTHQPSSIATAAIYLAAKEVGVKLPDCEWWEVFDVDREELGFLVVALVSMPDFAAEEASKWGRRLPPMTIEALQSELETRQLLRGSG